jgi:spermidine synthase
MDGSAALFSVEYYELAMQRLNEGGVISQWVPLYDTSEATARSLVGTFLEVFPEGSVWGSYVPGGGEGGPDLIMIGQLARSRVDADELTSRLEEIPRLARSLAEVGIEGALSLLATYVGNKRDLAEWLEDAQINRERSLRLQYLAGLLLEQETAPKLFGKITRYRSYPDDSFTVPYWMERRLRSVWK